MIDFEILKIDDLGVWVWTLKNGEFVGYTKINDDNSVYIFVDEKHRGNGYSKEMFKFLIKKLKDLKCSKIELFINRGNIQAIKLIENNNGIKISTEKENIRYLLPIDNN